MYNEWKELLGVKEITGGITYNEAELRYELIERL